MLRKIDQLLTEYGESHQNKTNKAIHWVCIPVILFSLFGLLMAIPFIGLKSIVVNWAVVVLVLALLYYMRLSIAMFLGFFLIGSLMVGGNYFIYRSINFDSLSLAKISFILFVLAWVGQFIGHHLEGKKPSFLKDLQFLLIGPAWLMQFVFKTMGIRY